MQQTHTEQKVKNRIFFKIYLERSYGLSLVELDWHLTLSYALFFFAWHAGDQIMRHVPIVWPHGLVTGKQIGEPRRSSGHPVHEVTLPEFLGPNPSRGGPEP